MRTHRAALRAGFAAILFLAAPAPAQPYAQKLSDSIVRWYESKEAADAAVPSHALEVQPKNPLQAGDFPIKPEFAKAGARSTAKITVDAGTSLYGAGREHAPLLRNGQTFHDGPVETPWVLGVRADGSAFGLLADTTYATAISLAGDIVFTSDDPRLPIIAIQGESPLDVVRTLTTLTGRMEMPPLWALGYQQFSAFNHEQLRHAAKWIREAHIPAGSLWLMVDPGSWPINYSPELVPDLKSLAAEVKAQGLRLIGGIGKTIPNTLESVQYAAALNGKHLLRTSDGRIYEDEMGEIKFTFVDYARKDTREWWAGRVKTFLEPGISGLTSARWTLGAVPQDIRIEADPELGGPDLALRYQNTLDTQFARASRDGFGGEASNRRPFVLLDARAVGAQRYTGALIDWPEQDPTWPRMFLDASLNTALSGQPLIGTLIKPPFQGEGSDTNLLWIGTAAAFPIAAGSFFLPGDFSEFPEPANTVIRLAMERRARLIPYIYTLCFSSFMECEPILRPLFFDDPKDPALRSNDSGFLLGPNLLVLPRPAPGAHASVPLTGSWRRLDLGDAGDPYLPDLYLRPGSILPLGPIMAYPGEKPLDPVTIIANPDDSGLAIGTLYEDAGDGYEFYRNQGRRIVYRITKEDGAFMVRLASLDFGLPLPARRLDIRILTDQGELSGSGSEKGTVKIDAATPKNSPGTK